MLRHSGGSSLPAQRRLSAVALLVFLLGLFTGFEEVYAELNKDGLPLPMSFEASSQVSLLFYWWDARTPLQYALSCLFCVFAGFVSIALKVLRRLTEVHLMLAEGKGKGILIFGSFPVYHNSLRGVVAFFNYTWDYMLMLVAMTFNVGIFFSMLAGIALGFLFIGHFLDYMPTDPSPASDNNPCCGCSAEFSCGCHRGHACTCCKTSKLVDTATGKKAEGQSSLIPQLGLSPSKSNCCKAKCSGV